MDTCIRMAESLCCLPEILTTLLISYTPTENVCMCAQQCPALCNFMDCNSQCTSIHGILQIKILEWVATSSYRGASRLRDWTWVACHRLHWQAGSLPLSHLGSQSLSFQPQRGLTARELLYLSEQMPAQIFSFKTFLSSLIWSKGPGHMEQVFMATSYITFCMGWQAASCSLQCPNTYAAVYPAPPQSKLSRKEKKPRRNPVTSKT